MVEVFDLYEEPTRTLLGVAEIRFADIVVVQAGKVGVWQAWRQMRFFHGRLEKSKFMFTSLILQHFFYLFNTFDDTHPPFIRWPIITPLTPGPFSTESFTLPLVARLSRCQS